MKVVILLRYPKVERSKWKRELIDNLINQEYGIWLFFGESSLWSQMRAALKQFGLDFFKKRKDIAQNSQLKLAKALKGKIRIIKVKDLNSKKSENLLYRIQPDLILLLGTGIIRNNILGVPKIGTVHCHQGYLPRYRGVNTIEWSILNDDDVYITTHFVNPGIDTGDILLRKKIDINSLKDAAEVRAKCQEEAVGLIVETINDIRDGSLKPIQQKKEEGKQYFTMHPFFLDRVNKKLGQNNS